jgi:hypothetical protein
MAARGHRPATVAPNHGQAGASQTPPPARSARSTRTSMGASSMKIAANPRHCRTCTRAKGGKVFQIDADKTKHRRDLLRTRPTVWSRPLEMARASPRRRRRFGDRGRRGWLGFGFGESERDECGRWADRDGPVQLNPWVELAGGPRGIFVHSHINLNLPFKKL